MSFVVGIDCGGSNTHGVLMQGRIIVRKCEIEGNSRKEAVSCFSKLTLGKKMAGAKIVLTGGGARRIEKGDFPGFAFSSVDEIEAIGKGGMFFSGKKDVFVVSMGTGTALVSVKKGKASHLGGTGIGGGTVKGLSSIMLGTNPDRAEEMAGKSSYALDLTVKDIVGKGIGKIPGNATAANFGHAHAGRVTKEEVAGSMFRMVAEAVGVMSYFAAKSAGQEKGILLCGRVAINDIVKKRIIYTISMFGGKAIVPKNAEYCAAIGAALSA